MTPGVLIIVLICAVTGMIIGSFKGHAVWGFFLGLVLSLIGIAIIAVTKPSPEYQAKKAEERLRAEDEARRRMAEREYKP